MLKEHLDLKAFIAPPQIYELSRLANFRDYASLLDFTLKREKYGIERWSYQITGMQDGALLALPGMYYIIYTMYYIVYTMQCNLHCIEI